MVILIAVNFPQLQSWLSFSSRCEFYSLSASNSPDQDLFCTMFTIFYFTILPTTSFNELSRVFFTFLFIKNATTIEPPMKNASPLLYSHAYKFIPTQRLLLLFPTSFCIDCALYGCFWTRHAVSSDVSYSVYHEYQNPVMILSVPFVKRNY